MTWCLEQVWTHSWFVLNMHEKERVAICMLFFALVGLCWTQHAALFNFKHQVGPLSKEVEPEG